MDTKKNMIKQNSFWQNWQKMKGKSYVKKNQLKQLVDFSNGENSFGPSPLISQKLTKLDIKDFNNYPDSKSTDVKNKISRLLKISKNMIAVGNGSDELIENLSRVFIEKGDIVMVITPTFFRFIDASIKVGGEICQVTAQPPFFKFSSDLIKQVKQMIIKNKPKLIWLNSPNNPTGETLAISDMVSIIKHTNNLVIVDEVYQELIDPVNKHSMAHLVSCFPNLVVIKSLSKAYGLAGVRFGYLVASKKIVAALEAWRLTYNINLFAQKLVFTALDDIEHLKAVGKKINQEKQWLFSKLKKMTNLEFTVNSKTNLFLIRHKKKDLFEELLKHKILTADFRNQMGIEGQRWVRVNIKKRNLNQLLVDKLKEIN